MLEETLSTPLRTARPRRLRHSEGLRRLVQETRVSPRQLVQPIFVEENRAKPLPVPSMPGVQRLGLDQLSDEAQEILDARVGAAILFGLPVRKDPRGTAAHDPYGIIPQAIRHLKATAPELVLIGDVCLCEYTDHGHCGLLGPDGTVENDATLDLLAKTAVAHANAGVDVVAPSAMMDGQVAALRLALDDAGHSDVAILSYAAKHASAYYGPFRQAADSAPHAGDRRGYQMDPANGREAMREIELDLREGADMVLLKPGLPALDLLRVARDRFGIPLGVYQVSGEYAMIKAAAERGWIDERRLVPETLRAFRRAGADFIITYYAKDAASLLETDW